MKDTNKNCNSCYSCNYCNSCNSCNSCNYCYSCNYCNYCYSCNYSSGLRMSEKMIFCLGDGKYESKGEGYQKNLRIFNQDVTEKEYERVIDSLDIKLKLTEWNDETKSLDVYSYKDAWANWWKEATKKQKESITKMKYFDKDIFTAITGIEDIETSDKVKIICDGNEVEISRESVIALNILKS